jgi:acetate---CoA ligase (ADP-forming)
LGAEVTTATERRAPVPRALDRMFGARSVAVVGASSRASSVGGVTLEQLLSGGFAGEVFPVNPRYDELQGRPCFPSLAEVPAHVELAILAVPDDALLRQLELAAANGVHAAVVFGGFSGVVPPRAISSPTHQEQLADRLGRIARDAGMLLCGPNGMGFLDLERGLRACGFRQPLTRRPGSIALISHSGSVFSAFLHNDRGLEFNLAISSGQEADLTAADYLAHALDRTSTEVVALFLETVRDPDGFRAALTTALERDIPVVALKVGSSARAGELVRAHSGGLAGHDGVYEALFDAYGVARVRSLDEMADTLELFRSGRRAGPGGLATIHDSGGERAHLADVAADEGVPFAAIGDATRERLVARLDAGLLPTNPLDAWGSGRDFAAAFRDLAVALHDDPDTGILALALDLTTEDDPSEGYLWTAREVLARSTKPVALLANLSSGIDPHDAAALRAAGVPVLEGTRSGLAAIRHLLRRRDVLARPVIGEVVRPADDVRERWRRWLDATDEPGEADVLALLEDYGLTVVEHRTAHDLPAAIEAGHALGWPVAVKTAVAGIAHKSDVGGVHLGVADPEGLATVYADLAERLGPQVLVSRMIPSGPELALGMVRDPQLGPVVVLAAGGTLTEVLHDRQVALPPLDEDRAGALLDRLRVRPILDGVRGGPPTDMAAVVDAVVRFSVLVDDLGDLMTAMDVNPLVAGPDACVAVDGLVQR